MKTAKSLIHILALGLWSLTAYAATEDFTDKLNQARFFEQPLVWVGTNQPAAGESEALWNAFGVGHVKRLDDAIGNLEDFIKTHPDSGWIPSLNGNLGRYYRDHGYFSLALQHWQAAWESTKAMTDAKGKQVADYTLVNWLQLLASLGRADTLKNLFAETQGRPLAGPLQYLYNQSRDGYAIMLNRPDVSYRCGTYALNAVAQKLYGTNYFVEFVNQPSPRTGFSMAALVDLAESNHLDMVAVQRPEGQDNLVVPSIVHWKQNHYAAILSRRGDLYEVADPTFRLHKWFTGEAINAESSGQFLMSQKQMPSGWKKLTHAQTAKIFGKGLPNNFPPSPPPCNYCPCPAGSGGTGGSSTATIGANASNAGGCSTCSANNVPSEVSGATGGMPDWKVNEPNIDLRLHDEPLAYQSSISRVSLQIETSEKGHLSCLF
jgi:hypothetical protein